MRPHPGTHPGPGVAGEFGALVRRSGRLLNEVSHVQIIGAENLLTKATHSVSAGDAQRAEQLIDRAAQMRYDAREEGSPGIRAASMLVYRLIVDQFQASEPDNTTWLGLAQLRSSWSERARRATSAQMVQVERARLGFLGIAG